MLNSEFVHFMRTAINLSMTNKISHRYQLEQSISVLRDVRWYFFIFIQVSFENLLANSGDPDQTRPIKKTLGIYGLKCNY